ncbi:hypothetical protein R0G64_31715, partial [Pseudomonas otitidis]|nr:hypothetical protein [Pseudomonas otitidis]
KIVARAREKGLILLSCGTYYNVIRFLMPVTIPDAQLGSGLVHVAAFEQFDGDHGAQAADVADDLVLGSDVT